MKPKLLVVLLVVAGLSLMMVASGCRHRRTERTSAKLTGNAEEKIAPSDVGTDDNPVKFSIVDKGGEGVDFAEREEIKRAYKLVPGARVWINTINGKVDVETADTETAEVLVVRSAKNREDLQYRQINIEHQPDFLQIRVEDDRKSIWSALGTRPEGHQRVMVRLPRKVELAIRGVNGPVTIGAIDGLVRVDGTNGAVNLGQATGSASFNGINGNIDATIAKLSGKGIAIRGVNGNTSLHFIGDVNAEIEAGGMNGKVIPEFQNIEEQKKEGFGRYHARIGSGGVRIEVSGVNGNVTLDKSEKTGTYASKTAARAKEN